MIVIVEILKYVFFAFILYSLAKRNLYIISGYKWNIYLFSFVAIFSLISAVRFNVGGDCLTYMKIFRYGMIFNHNEKFWNFIVSTLHYFGFHFVFGMGIMAFLQIFFIVQRLKEFPFILLMLPIVLFGGRYYIDLMGAIRQMVAASMFFWGSRYIFERKLWRYLIVVLVCSLFHQSAWILILIYFISNRLIISDKRFWMLAIFFLCFILGQFPSFQFFGQYAGNFANFIGYDNYSIRVADFLVKGDAKEALNFGPMMLSYFLLALILIWYGPQLKQRYESIIPYFNLWYNLSYIYACFYFLICNVSHIFIRPVQYLELFQLIIASLLLYDFFKLSKENSIYRLHYIIFIIIIWMNIVWDIYKNVGTFWDMVTYKTIFFNFDKLQMLIY